MARVKLDDELQKMNNAELVAQLKELKAELSRPVAKVIDGDPDKLSEIQQLRTAMAPLITELQKKHKAALREVYNKKREPFRIRSNSQEDPCHIPSPPAHQTSEGKEARQKYFSTLLLLHEEV